jgi:hypothetical protein
MDASGKRINRNGNRYSSKRSIKSLRSKQSVPTISQEAKHRFENNDRFEREI